MDSTFFKRNVDRIVTEGTMRTAYLKDINRILCPIPNIESQQHISSMFRSLSDKLKLEEDVIIAFKLQKDYLLNQLFI